MAWCHQQILTKIYGYDRLRAFRLFDLSPQMLYMDVANINAESHK